MTVRAVALLAALILFPGTQVGAQPGAGGRGPGPSGRGYDPNRVETVTGEVLSVSRGKGPGGGGVHLLLRTDAGTTLSVRLGPASYVDRQSMKIQTGDRLEIRGSRIDSGGEPTIIAAKVTKGRAEWLLRNEAGVPAWSGQGRRGTSP